MPNNNSWEAPFPYDETNNIVQNYAEQNAQFYNNLERGYTPQQLNQAYNPPQYNASVWQTPAPAMQQSQPAPAMQQFQQSQQAAERLDAEQQFAAQMEQLGFIILDVPFYTDKPERNKAAQNLGVIQEKFHSIIQKDIYENTPELHVYGQDKRLYVNANYETARQIQNELNESVLQFDSIANMYFLAGHTIEDDPNILDYVESSPNVHGVGTLEEMQEEREAYKKKPEPQQAKPMPTMQPFQKFKNDFPTQSYLKFCELEMENIKPQDPFMRSFKKTAKSLGVNTLWDGKMKVWKLDVPQDSKEFAILLKRYGSSAQEKKYYEKLDATQQVLFYSRLSSIDSKTYSKIFEPNSKLYSKISKMLESKAIAMQQKQQQQNSNFLEKQESQKKGRGR